MSILSALAASFSRAYYTPCQVVQCTDGWYYKVFPKETPHTKIHQCWSQMYPKGLNTMQDKAHLPFPLQSSPPHSLCHIGANLYTASETGSTSAGKGSTKRVKHDNRAALFLVRFQVKYWRIWKGSRVSPATYVFSDSGEKKLKLFYWNMPGLTELL